MLLLRPATLSAVPALVAILVLLAAAQQTTNVNSALVTVSGTVYDSLNARPLAGALVQLAASDLHGSVLSVPTDSVGDFHIPGVRPGAYLVGFTHPLLDSLGLDVPPLRLKVDGGTPLRLSLAIPTALAIRGQLCPATQPADSSGVMLGYLRDADTGAHLDSGAVILEWTEVTVSKDGKSILPDRRSVNARATRAGWYALCGVPTAGPIAARAEIDGNTTGESDDTSETRAAPLRRGHARLTGIVRDKGGKPLHGARLHVWGSDITASTDDAGRFSLAGLPSGTQTLEARQIGYAQRRVVVDLPSHRTDSVTVMLDKVADVLGEVTVYGEPSALSKKLAGFASACGPGGAASSPAPTSRGEAPFISPTCCAEYRGSRLGPSVPSDTR